MTNAKKHKNGKFSGNMFCAIAMGNELMFFQSLKL